MLALGVGWGGGNWEEPIFVGLLGGSKMALTIWAKSYKNKHFFDVLLPKLVDTFFKPLAKCAISYAFYSTFRFAG